MNEKTIVLLLIGGDKTTQTQDIATAWYGSVLGGGTGYVSSHEAA